MEDSVEADFGPEMLRVAAEHEKRSRSRVEYQIVHRSSVEHGEPGNVRRDREHGVVAVDGKKLRKPLFDPFRLRDSLAGRTMAVAARVVPDAEESATVADVRVPAVRLGTAVNYGVDGLALLRRKPSGFQKLSSFLFEDVGYSGLRRSEGCGGIRVFRCERPRRRDAGNGSDRKRRPRGPARERPLRMRGEGRIRKSRPSL